MLTFVLAAFVFILLLAFDRKRFEYWKELGCPQLKPKFLIGDIKDLALQNKPGSIFFQEIYNKSKSHPVIGLYFSYRPTILVSDAELAKRILTEDFQYFHDRGFFIDPKIDPLSKMLFCLSGEKWKKLRQKVTPLFSTSKLKKMVPIIHDTYKLLENKIDENLEHNHECTLDIRDTTAKFALTLISSIAFGLHNDCINNPDNIFRTKTLKVLEPGFISNTRFMMALFMPKLSETFKIGFFSKEVNEFYIDITRKIVEYRDNHENNINRTDFLHLFMQLRNLKENFTLHDIAANSFVFVVAGYESTASTISYCLFELARNPEILQNVQEEIDQMLDGDLSFEKIKKLKYLDYCVSETLRKYPPIPFLNRLCKYDYQVPGTKLIIPKGTPVIIPIFAIQHDSEIYPNPSEFIPERFEQKNDISLMSFGLGNRTCIAKNMGTIVSKCFISNILSKYTIELISSKELKYSPKVPSLTPIDKILIKFKKRK